MSKQTAVEWYGIQIGILISKFLNGEISKSNLHFKRLLLEIEAMQMEKEQKELELPTDEEIEKEFTMGNQIFVDRINGAKWMRDKIKGGQDE